eukprot:CAMPEP_0204432400 /NCGR_PEP_ID=MMETSP0470-20130426/67224_1 /ASSEMBLY_ACC=CAM_ASM_000385 /TAXON_ID=2969 /ORGANISM="Oxyrrhis marina" /LENGTH=186 /DNA_ID=CAMNT_0051430701 /DNA_START=408 /DNA_END=963 /DNA_ORIENTATION=-
MSSTCSTYCVGLPLAPVPTLALRQQQHRHRMKNVYTARNRANVSLLIPAPQDHQDEVSRPVHRQGGTDEELPDGAPPEAVQDTTQKVQAISFKLAGRNSAFFQSGLPVSNLRGDRLTWENLLRPEGPHGQKRVDDDSDRNKLTCHLAHSFGVHGRLLGPSQKYKLIQPKAPKQIHAAEPPQQRKST